MKRLSGMGYVGGKSANGRGSGPWIADQLPLRGSYFEPFAGMLGVLLQRPKSKREVVNDLDHRVINWWTALREDWEEMARRFYLTPRWSPVLFEEAVAKEEQALADGDRVAAAYYMTIRTTMGFGRMPNSTKPGRSYDVQVGVCPPLHHLEVRRLWERIKKVELECIDALDFLDRYGQIEGSVFYCDPPYPTGAKVHTHSTIDMAALSDQLKKVTGFCAISGYGDEWDHLGWHRYELDIKNTLVETSYVGRTEVLWSNEPTSGQTTLSL